MSYCAAVSCIDGKTHLSVIRYLQQYFNVKYVDLITEPGMNLVLAESKNHMAIASTKAKLKIAIEAHMAVGIAVVGHADCLGNPSDKAGQIVHIRRAMSLILQLYNQTEIIGLWVDENLKVEPIAGV